MKLNLLSKIPHPVVLLFGIFIIISILSYWIPSGKYERQLVDGRSRVVANTYQEIPKKNPGIVEIFTAIPLGFRSAIDIVFVVIISGIMFGFLEKTNMIENMVGTGIRKLGMKNRSLFVFILTFLFGLLGVFVGYESNIALVPIAAVICLAIKADLMLAAGIAVGGITVGFGLSPINPYTVGIGHQIAELPIFSGALLRSVLCFSGLLLLALYNVRYLKKITLDPSQSQSLGIETKDFKLKKPIDSYSISSRDLAVFFIFCSGLAFMLWGVFTNGWYLKEISAVFVMISVAIAFFTKTSVNQTGELILKSVAVIAPGAFMVGLAASIKVIMEMTVVGDTIAFFLADSLNGLPDYLAVLGMSVAQCVINLVIPSGSGQALATLPVMIPVGDILGITRQTTILAFQIGDGVTNLFNPTLGGLVAMVGMCRIPFNKWLAYIMPLTLIVLLVSWAFLLISVAISWN